MNGPEFVNKLSELCPETKFVYINGYVNFELQEEITNSTVPIIQKPFTIDHLINKIRESFGDIPID